MLPLLVIIHNIRGLFKRVPYTEAVAPFLILRVSGQNSNGLQAEPKLGVFVSFVLRSQPCVALFRVRERVLNELAKGFLAYNVT